MIDFTPAETKKYCCFRRRILPSSVNRPGTFDRFPAAPVNTAEILIGRDAIGSLHQTISAACWSPGAMTDHRHIVRHSADVFRIDMINQFAFHFAHFDMTPELHVDRALQFADFQTLPSFSH
ncbi:MAG: hypothetical protein ACLVJ6_02740 [Merdibacter sp.]